MNEAHPMNFTEAVIAGVRDAMASTLTCEAAPVQLPLRLLLSGQQMPIRALVTCSFHSGQAGIDAGAALDLIHLSLQRLHAGIDKPGSTSALLGNAAAVLAGDYLTTGAFRLLVRCANLRVLDMVSGAVTRAAEFEAANLNRAPGTGDDQTRRMQIRQKLAAPLGEAAGATGAALACYPDPLADMARRYGEILVASHVLFQEADAMENSEALALQNAARDLCNQAVQEAQAIAMATGNRRPLELAELVAASLGVKLAKCNLQ